MTTLSTAQQESFAAEFHNWPITYELRLYVQIYFSILHTHRHCMNRFFHCSAKKAAGDIHRECATIIKNTLYDEGIVNRTPYYGGNLAFNFLVFSFISNCCVWFENKKSTCILIENCDHISKKTQKYYMSI